MGPRPLCAYRTLSLRGQVGLILSVFVLAFSVLGYGLVWTSWRAIPELPDESSLVPVTAIRQAWADAHSKPRNSATVGRLGMLLHAWSQNDTAALVYRRAHLLDPKAFEWAYYLGVIEAARGLPQAAVVAFADAVRLNSGYLPGRLRLAACLLELGKLHEAERLYRTVLDKYRFWAEPHYGLGRIYASRGDARAAIAEFLKACELFPAYAAAHYALSQAYTAVGDPGAATHHFALYRRYKSTRPPSGDSLLEAVERLNVPGRLRAQAGASWAAGDLPRAAEAFEKLVALEPGSTAVAYHVNLIAIYGNMGQLERAMEHYRNALALNPDHPEIHLRYGILLREHHDYVQARTAFRKTLALDPRHPGAHTNLGILAEQQGHVTEAISEYRLATELDPGSALAQFRLGRLLLRSGKEPDAAAHFLQALSADEREWPSLLRDIAGNYREFGSSLNAREFARQATLRASEMGVPLFKDEIAKAFPAPAAGK